MAVALEAAIAALVVLGLTAPAQLRSGAQAALTAFDLAPPPPPPHLRHAAHSGAAAPSARRADASPVVAPPVPHPLASPISAAPVPAEGTAPRNGASDQPGIGSGAGGNGAGTGSGAGGDGAGDGGNDAEWLRGRITNSDYPAAARDARAQGVTRTRIDITTDGRPSGCTVRRSSGDRLLDETTCRLVLARFHFRPARDQSGRAVADSVDYEQEWSISGYTGD